MHRRHSLFLAAMALLGLGYLATFGSLADASSEQLRSEGTETQPLGETYCRGTNYVVEEQWEAFPRVGRHVAEWITPAGPTIIGSAPKFDCLRLHATPDPEARHLDIKQWCVPHGTARVRWRVLGGTPPFQLSISGLRANADRGFLDIPCDWILNEVLGGKLEDHAIAEMDVHLKDSAEHSLTASVSVGVVGRPPEGHIDEIRMIPGPYDVSVIPNPWTFRIPEPGDTTDLPIGQVAILRVRPIGERTWQYGTAFPPPSSGSCRWCRASHAGGLRPETGYELQAAWMWHAGYSTRSQPTWSPWTVYLPNKDKWWTITWWESWISSGRANWSQSFHFRTLGNPQLSAEASSDTIVVRWPATTGEFEVTATSPDWPGVTWADPNNGYPYPRWEQGKSDGVMSAVLQGMPPDSEFEIRVKQFVPALVSEPWSVVRVRTLAETGEDARTPGLADPRAFDVRLIDNVVQLAWDRAFPIANTSPILIRFDNHGTGFDEITETASRTTWHTEDDFGLELFLQQDTDRIRTDRMRVNFPPVPYDSYLQLNISRTPGQASTDALRVPFQCVVWKIRVPAVDPRSYLDTYWHSSEEHGAPVLVRATPRQPVRFQDGTRQWTWTYPECKMDRLTGE